MEQLWNRNYCKVMTANLLLFSAFYIVTPLLPLYLSEHFSATKDVIGLVLSGFSLTALLCRPFSGYFVDTFPRKRVLMCCFVLFTLFFLGYPAATGLLLFSLVRTLHGGPFGALTVANSTVAIDVLPSSRRTEGIGYYGLSNNLAMALAPTLGIWLYNFSHSYHLLFWLAFALACLGALVAQSVRLPERPTRTACSRLSLDRFFLLRDWLLGLNMVCFGFCFGVLSNYLAIYGKERLGITGGTGTYFLLLAGGLMLSRLTGARSLRRGQLTGNAWHGMLISLMGYALFTLWPAMPGYYGSALLIGLGNGHMWPAFQNMTICVAPNNRRGTANSTILISWDIGMGLGILGGGIVAQHLDYEAAFLTMTAVNLLGVLIYRFATRAFFRRRNLDPMVK